MSDKKYRINWEKDWNSQACMWQQAYGHTPPIRHLKKVHSSRKAATMILLAAETGQLDRIETTGILKKLDGMVFRDKSRFHGYIRWYMEEDLPSDPNSTFFAGLPLIITWKKHGSMLSEEQREITSGIFRDMYVWFKRESMERTWFYPNKSLGELTCAWMIWEICREIYPGMESEKGELLKLMEEAAFYWTENMWGWGEHMSDGYCKVCLTELSVLLLLGKSLPGKTKDSFRKLFDRLLEVEDMYEGGPRVPALRTYAFSSCPANENYRDTIKPLPGEIDISKVDFVRGHTFYDLGWHQFAPPRKPAAVEARIECFNKAFAVARIEKDIRAGSVSRFPLMPSMDRINAGLSWQSMPVAVSRPGKTWMYLQWETEEEGRIRSHPATDVKEACFNYGLSGSINPPVTGRTYSIQEGNGILVLRIMPSSPALCARITDRLRVIGDPGEVEEPLHEGPWHQLLMRWEDREISVHSIPLPFFDRTSMDLPVLKTCGNFCELISPETAKMAPVSMKLKRNGKCLDWDGDNSGVQLRNRRIVATLWAFCLDGRIGSPPVLNISMPTPPLIPRMYEENGWEITWKWPGKNWNLLIDPLGSEPLKETGPARDA